MILELPIHDPLLIFSIVMLNVLIAPIIAEKLKLPGILGLIISGVIFGPHLFGIIERDRTVQLFGAIGILYIMFQAGLEINISEVKKNKHHSLLFGFFTFIIPLILGTISGFYILRLNILQSVLFASMFSSHTLLTFPLVSKLGLSKRPEVSTTIGGTIITDTFALLILAVIIKMYNGSINHFFWMKLFISISLYTISVLFLLPKLTRWFFKKFANENGIEEYVFIFSLLFIVSYLAHFAGLEPIIGAFLVGLSLNRLIPEKSILMNRIHFVGNSLFIPYFLISVGMIIEPKSFISDWKTWEVSLVMIITALISKYLASYFFGKIVKYDSTQKNLMFGLSVNQAAATLAAVLIGFELGIFNETILSGTIMMIIVTTFVGAVTTNKAVKTILSKVTRTHKKKKEKLSERILLPIHNPNNINNLTDLAFYLSDESEGEPIYPLGIVIDGNDVEKDLEKSEEILTKILLKGVASNKNIIPLTKIDSNISEAINKTCKEYRTSKVILGWGGKSNILKNLFNGSTVEQYIKNSKEMIFIANIVEKLDLSRDLILIVPPFITMQKGFSEAMNSVIKLCKELNDKLIILSDEKTLEDIKDYLKSSKIDIMYKSIKSFKKIDIQIKDSIKENDLIIQLCSRNWELSWRLDLEKLSYEIPEIFSNNSFISLYPYSYDEDDKEIAKIFIKDEFFQNIEPKNLIINHKQKNLDTIILDYIREHNILNTFALEELVKEKPIELSHEIALIHNHVNGISEAQIFLVSNKSGIFIKSSNKEYKIIILLLSPKSLQLKEHLELLSEIAKFSKNHKKIDILYDSKNYNDFINKLNKE